VTWGRTPKEIVQYSRVPWIPLESQWTTRRRARANPNPRRELAEERRGSYATAVAERLPSSPITPVAPVKRSTPTQFSAATTPPIADEAFKTRPRAPPIASHDILLKSPTMKNRSPLPKIAGTSCDLSLSMSQSHAKAISERKQALPDTPTHPHDRQLESVDKGNTSKSEVSKWKEKGRQSTKPVPPLDDDKMQSARGNLAVKNRVPETKPDNYDSTSPPISMIFFRVHVQSRVGMGPTNLWTNTVQDRLAGHVSKLQTCQVGPSPIMRIVRAPSCLRAD
jgi:hypothetical protein